MRSREEPSTHRPRTHRVSIAAGIPRTAGRSGTRAFGARGGSEARLELPFRMHLSPSARPAARLSVLLLLAACQPQARRLLLLDLALSDPVVLNGTARPWVDAGYTVRYRRFYPHLTRGDLPRFRTLVLLLGREPEAPSDALTAGDLTLLDEWVRRGGVVVLGYDGDGEGYLDRWTANRWLEYEGAGISIGDRMLEDTTGPPPPPTTTRRPQPRAQARAAGDGPAGPGYGPFPLGPHPVITLGGPAPRPPLNG